MIPLLLSPLQYPVLVAAAFAVALGAWVFTLGPGRPVNRAFALFLTFRGLTYTAVAFITDERWGPLFYGRLHPYVLIAGMLATAHFGLAYHHTYAHGRRWRGGWALLAVGAAAWIAYAVDHDLFWRVAFVDGAFETVQRGPLVELTTLGLALEAAIGLLLVRDATRTSGGPRQSSLLLVGLALLALPLYLGVGRLVVTPFIGTSRPLASWLNIALSLAAVALAAMVLARARARTRDGPHGRALAALLGVALVGFIVVGLAVAIGDPSSNSSPGALLGYFGGGTVSVAALLLIAYSILRHQLFDLDVRIKWTLKQSTIAAIFVAVFFVVSETAQQMFEGSIGPFLGIAAAGALVFAIHPLQQVAQRVADKAMPGVKGAGEMTSTERLDLYREQLRAAWADGQLSADERKLLRVTRDKLGISADDALAIEEEVAPR